MSFIKVENLSKIYKRTIPSGSALANFFSPQHEEIVAVDNLSFEIEEGEIVGFIGANGAGKTTTMKMLSGLIYPTSGKVEVSGYQPQKRDRDFLRQIALVMGQKQQLQWDLPVRESLELNAAIYSLADKQYRDTVAELTEVLDMAELLEVQVRKLSLGQRMKAEIMLALIHRPKLMLLDEPTIGLDVSVQKNIRQFIKEHNRRYKTTIMLTSHYMDDVRELCQRIIVIDKGGKAYDGSLAELIKSYAKDKYLQFIFEKPVNGEDFSKYGEAELLDDFTLRLRVPREQHTKVAAQILLDYPVDDLDIQEVKLEEIITEMIG